jgi:multicomponent Na+:H+ antiporter subunit D
MLLAMGISAFLCVAIGVYPQPLYDILPYPVDFEPYTASHVVTQLQLLVFALLAFVVLALKHLETPELRCTNVDFDVLYRRVLPAVLRGVGSVVAAIRDGVIDTGKSLVGLFIAVIRLTHGPSGVAARTVLTSTAVAIVIVLLFVHLLFNYLTS